MLVPRVTPLIKIFDKKRNNIIYLKDETKQYTNAFKYRGVYNKFRKINLEKYNGVITASTGNHGQAVSFAASQFGIKCIVVLPYNTPILKKEKIIKNQAIIVSNSDLVDYNICTKYAVDMARKENLLYIPSFDDMDIIDGHKSLFEEIGFHCDYCFCPVGGGGIVSAALESNSLNNTKIFGVELVGQDSMNQSLKKHRLVSVNIDTKKDSFCEGILVSKVGKNNFNIAKRKHLDISLVSEDDIVNSIKELYKFHIRAEGAGASAYAAYLKSDISNSSVLCIISGGNIDDDIFQSIVGDMS